MTAIARMGDFTARRLTDGERALARVAFAAEDFADVRVVQTSALAPFGAMVPRGEEILFGRWRAARDFARASRAEQGWFVHELAHVWQARRGAVLALAKLAAIGRAAYRVRLDGRGFDAFNIEAQAEIARFAFLARIGAPDKAGPDPAALEALWPIPRG